MITKSTKLYTLDLFRFVFIDHGGKSIDVSGVGVEYGFLGSLSAAGKPLNLQTTRYVIDAEMKLKRV